MSSEGFCFNFGDDDNEMGAPRHSSGTSFSTATETATAVLLSQFPVYSLTSQALQEWVENYSKSTKEEVKCTTAEKNAPTLLYQRAPHVEELTATSDKERRDIIPGKYYGGLKVWSCAPYLVEYMFSNRNVFIDLFAATMKPCDGTTIPAACCDNKLLNDAVVAEVGCGQGLPGIAALMLGARHVIFQDYNREVLELCVKPNIAANLLRHAGDPSVLCEASSPPIVRLVPGDWSHIQWQEYNEATGKETHDLRCKVVLGSDITFDEEACDKLAGMLRRCLSPSGGVAYIAGKQYYFGTHGGALEFQRRAESYGLEVSEVDRVVEGGGMQRLIVRVKHRG